MFESTRLTFGIATAALTPTYTEATATGIASGPSVGLRGIATPVSPAAGASSPESRAELRSRWIKAKRAVTAIAEALEHDPPASYGPACDLNTALDAMWKLRKQRGDDNWTGILDRLQTTLRELGGDGVSLLTPVQGRKLEEFVHSLLSLSEKSERELLEAIRLMDEIGVPPFVDLAAPTRTPD